MRNAVRQPRSYSIDPDLHTYIAETKGDRSASERVNELLKLAIEQEELQALERDASKFFANPKNHDRQSARAFQRSAIRVQKRAK